LYTGLFGIVTYTSAYYKMRSVIVKANADAFIEIGSLLREAVVFDVINDTHRTS
jgi:hypothetical protein